jgi:hypothetical protein
MKSDEKKSEVGSSGIRDSVASREKLEGMFAIQP